MSNLDRVIVEAYIEGLSICEIGRLLNRKPGVIHTLLRKNKAVEALESQPSKTHSVGGDWLKALRDDGLSLERWCIGWGFDVNDVITEMRAASIIKIDIAEALMRDFPRIYESRHTGTRAKRIKRLKQAPKKLKLVVEWEDEICQYIVTADGGLTAFGLTPTEAVSSIERAFKEQALVEQLKNGLEQYKSLFVLATKAVSGSTDGL